jgi:hypothetical protein
MSQSSSDPTGDVPQPGVHQSSGPTRSTPPDTAAGPIVLTIGDVSFDWLCFSIAKDRDGTDASGTTLQDQRAWIMENRVDIPVVHGGAWYVDTYLRMLLGPNDKDDIFTYRRLTPAALRACHPTVVLQSLTEYGLFAGSDRDDKQRHEFTPDDDSVYRAKGLPRFFGPLPDAQLHPIVESASGPDDLGDHVTSAKIDCIEDELKRPRKFPAATPRIVVVFDCGNGFSSIDLTPRPSNGPATTTSPSAQNDAKATWIEALPPKSTAINSDQSSSDAVRTVILTLPLLRHIKPMGSHRLWQYLDENHYLDRTILVVDANDLRRAGVQISRSESWERTAYDFVAQLDSDPLLNELCKAGELIVRFGISGLIHRRKDSAVSELIFDPAHVEGEYRNPRTEGSMFGYDAVICASIAADLLKQARTDPAKPRDLHECLPQALGNCRAFFRHGCGRDSRNRRSEAEHWDTLVQSTAPVPLFKSRRNLRFTVCNPYEFDPRTEYDLIASAPPVRSDATESSQYATRVTVGIHIDPARPCTLSRYPSKVVNHIVDRCSGLLTDWMAHVGIPTHAAKRDVPNATVPNGEWICELTPISAQRGAGGIHIDIKRAGTRVGEEDLTKISEQLLAKLTDHVRSGKALAAHEPEFADSLFKEIEDGDGVVTKLNTLLRAIVIHFHESVSREMHWRYRWPVCVFGLHEHTVFARARIENSSTWRILNPKISNPVEIAKRIVREGLGRVLDDSKNAFPVARFGDLATVDRHEIESYRSIRNLIQEYTDKDSPPRPLCIAVFGPPGSGKSFGVKQIAKTVSPKKESKPYEFNLAQFSSTGELANALIQVRDVALAGIRPLVFFDEFDSEFEHEPLGWLKHFLSVMQDGEFKHGDLKLKIGSPILVFAGGTSSSYREFTRKDRKETDKEGFQSAKGPDFVSRLRGFVDTTGPDRRNEGDDVFIIRRAVILRSIIETSYKNLLGKHKEAQIDRGVLNALLRVPRYEHGVRSIEAIFEMSRVGSAQRFEKSSLPPRDQLEMHLFRGKEVDSAVEFVRLLREE